MSALASGGPAGQVLTPYWLSGADRDAVAAAVRVALEGDAVHPVAAIHLQDVLTELHVATVRDAVWPASAARVRRATGWGADVLPVRFSAVELAGVLALPALPAAVRRVLDGGVLDGGVLDGGVLDGGVLDGGVLDGGVLDGGA